MHLPCIAGAHLVTGHVVYWALGDGASEFGMPLALWLGAFFACVPHQMHVEMHAAHRTYHGVYRVFSHVSGPCPWI